MQSTNIHPDVQFFVGQATPGNFPHTPGCQSQKHGFWAGPLQIATHPTLLNLPQNSVIFSFTLRPLGFWGCTTAAGR